MNVKDPTRFQHETRGIKFLYILSLRWNHGPRLIIREKYGFNGIRNIYGFNNDHISVKNAINFWLKKLTQESWLKCEEE